MVDELSHGRMGYSRYGMAFVRYTREWIDGDGDLFADSNQASEQMRGYPGQLDTRYF
jgi:hypothetical protein